MVALVRDRRGWGWAPGQRDALAAPEGRSPGSGSCGPARRPGPRRLGGGSAPVPRRARVLESGQHQAGRPFGDSKARRCDHGGCWILAWSQAGCEQVLGRDSPEPTLTGDGAWRLVGTWEAPGGQVAADRRDRHPAGPSCLSDREARFCPPFMLIRSRLWVAHDRSLSRSVRR